MKKILLILAVALAFASCKKEELEPAPENNNPPSGITGKTLSFAASGFPDNNGQAYLEVPNDMNFGTTITTCGMGSIPDNYTLQVDVVYNVEFVIGTSVVYDGDIKINSDGNLVEVTGNTVGTATVAIDGCNTAIGDQIVVSP